MVRMAKIRPIITSRKIKDNQKFPESYVTIRIRLTEAKLSERNPCQAIVEKTACAESVPICQGTHRLAKIEIE